MGGRRIWRTINLSSHKSSESSIILVKKVMKIYWITLRFHNIDFLPPNHLSAPFHIPLGFQNKWNPPYLDRNNKCYVNQQKQFRLARSQVLLLRLAQWYFELSILSLRQHRINMLIRNSNNLYPLKIFGIMWGF